ncbi:transmembrane protein, putative [Medicago truncatula]|uniref:Transmembrane protein, putative n=1 Tax=Medicago truncatula TaxID=3880 RepID=G7KJN7_MEDTR|nr:transmembrane protein, putative [Medicago truncatula]
MGAANSFFGTKVILKGDLPEVEMYKKKVLVVWLGLCSVVIEEIGFRFGIYEEEALCYFVMGFPVFVYVKGVRTTSIISLLTVNGFVKREFRNIHGIWSA